MDTPRTTAVEQVSLVDETPTPERKDPDNVIDRLADILAEIALTAGD